MSQIDDLIAKLCPDGVDFRAIGDFGELVRGNGVLELSALTRRAQLSTGALYHHFGSKSGLLAAVYDDFYHGLRHAIADAHRFVVMIF